jgi:hypothetical protein
MDSTPRYSATSSAMLAPRSPIYKLLLDYHNALLTVAAI